MSIDAASPTSSLSPLAKSEIDFLNNPTNFSYKQVGDINEKINFSDLVSKGIQKVNQQLLVSQVDLQELSAGNVQNLHQIMIRLEDSKLSFQLLMQIRSRLLEAYQDVMKMQL